MTTKTVSLVACVLLLIPTTRAAGAQLTEEEKRADFERLLDEWLPNHALLSAEQSLEVREFLLASRESAADLDDTAFALADAASYADNGHDLAGFGLIERMPRLPFRVWWFEDGLFVVKAPPAQADLLGARVDALGERSPEELYADAQAYLPGSEPWVRHRSVEFLTRMPFLAALGGCTDADRVPVTFTLPDGSSLEREFLASDEKDPEDDPADPWLSSILRTPGQEGSSTWWQHVTDFVQERPAYLRSRDMVWYEPLEGTRAAYLRLASIRNPEGPGSLHRLLFDVIDRLQADQPENLVIDLRYNTGGNFFNAVPFSYGVGVVLPDDAKI